MCGWLQPRLQILMSSSYIRTTLKQDLGCSVAELVYGTTLRIPGEFFFFFTSTASTGVDAASYVEQLKATMRHLQATYTPPRVSDRPKVYSLSDAVRKPLQQPYDGPFKVLLRSDKYFTLDINGRKDEVSVDRLKPAYLFGGATQRHHRVLFNPLSCSFSSYTYYSLWTPY